MSEISEKSSERRCMSSLAEATWRMRRLAEPTRPGEGVKAALRRAGAVLDAWCKANGELPWTSNRIRDVWNGDRRIAVSAEEIRQLREAVAARRRKEQEAKDEFRQIADGIAALVGRMAAVDPDFYQQAIEALGAAASAHLEQADGSGLARDAVDRRRQ